MANYSFSTIHAGGPFADGYDAEDRFMRFKRSGVTEDILLTRSNIGNISNVNRNGTNTARGYNTAHGLTTVTGGTTQTYDTDGNTTTLHTNVTAVWDDAGRMKNTNVPAGATAGIQGLNENGYVGGNRIWKKITRSGSVVEHRVHIHAGPNLIAEYNAGVAASTPVQEYVYAGEIDSLVMIRLSDATKYGVTRNRQWSITALHDLANGTIVERYAYEMTGKRTIYAANGTTIRTTSSYGNNFGYTNRWHDEDSSLMYFRARQYNPLTGEFLSRDPMEFVDGMSLYRGYFVCNFVDPEGLDVVFSGDPAIHRPFVRPEQSLEPCAKCRVRESGYEYITPEEHRVRESSDNWWYEHVVLFAANFVRVGEQTVLAKSFAAAHHATLHWLIGGIEGWVVNTIPQNGGLMEVSNTATCEMINEECVWQYSKASEKAGPDSVTEISAAAGITFSGKGTSELIVSSEAMAAYKSRVTTRHSFGGKVGGTAGTKTKGISGEIGYQFEIEYAPAGLDLPRQVEHSFICEKVSR